MAEATFTINGPNRGRIVNALKRELASTERAHKKAIDEGKTPIANLLHEEIRDIENLIHEITKMK